MNNASKFKQKNKIGFMCCRGLRAECLNHKCGKRFCETVKRDYVAEGKKLRNVESLLQRRCYEIATGRKCLWFKMKLCEKLLATETLTILGGNITFSGVVSEIYHCDSCRDVRTSTEAFRLLL